MVNDPIADLLTRIRNAQRAKHKSVLVPVSATIKRILEVLKKEGFIESFSAKEKAKASKVKEGEKAEPTPRNSEPRSSELRFGSIDVVLRYYESGDPLIGAIDRVSSPGMRVYSAVEDLPIVYSGLGISILSTSQGVMSDRDARKKGIGGEVLARVG